MWKYILNADFEVGPMYTHQKSLNIFLLLKNLDFLNFMTKYLIVAPFARHQLVWLFSNLLEVVFVFVRIFNLHCWLLTLTLIVWKSLCNVDDHNWSFSFIPIKAKAFHRISCRLLSLSLSSGLPRVHYFNGLAAILGSIQQFGTEKSAENAHLAFSNNCVARFASCDRSRTFWYWLYSRELQIKLLCELLEFHFGVFFAFVTNSAAVFECNILNAVLNQIWLF